MSVKEGTHVVIVDNSGNRRVLKVKAGRKIKHFKVMIDLTQLVDSEFGQHYQVRDPKSGELEPITDVKVLTKAFLETEDLPEETGQAEEEEEKEEVGDGVTNRDNRDIVDNNQAQKLTQEQIEALKSQGLTGGELISKIIENSETFQKRTKFSQEKYLRKKMQKYLVRFEVKKPTVLELCEAYSQTGPNKI